MLTKDHHISQALSTVGEQYKSLIENFPLSLSTVGEQSNSLIDNFYSLILSAFQITDSISSCFCWIPIDLCFGLNELTNIYNGTSILTQYIMFFTLMIAEYALDKVVNNIIMQRTLLSIMLSNSLACQEE